MTLLGVDEAQRLALEHATARGVEELVVYDAAGRIAAAPVSAALELPASDVSIMDGYACALATARAGSARVVGESAAGHPWLEELGPGDAVRISTGAVVPRGAAVVIAQEDARRDGDTVAFDPEVAASVVVGRHIRPAGSDVRRGDVLVREGEVLGPTELALLAGAGVSRLSVHRRPRLAILSTGDELLPVGAPPREGHLVDTNAPMLAALGVAAGAEVVSCRTVGDDPLLLTAALDHAIAVADVVLTTGGASVGDHDHVRRAAGREGLEILAWGIAMRPGKPTGIVRTGSGLWFALPGNPASTFVAYELFARPALRRMLGVRGDPRRPLRRMIAGGVFPGERTREHWVRARTEGDTVVPLPDQLSGNLRSLAGGDALVRVPPGVAAIEPSAACDVLLLDAHAHAHERVS